jgi:transposase InsO family protein
MLVLAAAGRTWAELDVMFATTSGRPNVEACGWDEAPRCLIRDRDRSYGEVFVRRVRAMGIRDRPRFLRSPWQNGYAERLIGAIRRECIDHVIVFGECHLRHLLRSYLKYYNETRTHLSLDKDAPIPRAIEFVGHILARPSWVACITNTCGSNFREAQVIALPRVTPVSFDEAGLWADPLPES